MIKQAALFFFYDSFYTYFVKDFSTLLKMFNLQIERFYFKLNKNDSIN